LEHAAATPRSSAMAKRLLISPPHSDLVAKRETTGTP
jgi:hypothetical protein